MEFATIKLGYFGNKIQVILPDGRDIAGDLYVQRIEIIADREDFTLAKITCAAKVEANLFLVAVSLSQKKYEKVVRNGIALLYGEGDFPVIAEKRHD